MTGNHDDAIASARLLRNDVADGKLPFCRPHSESVIFDQIAFQVGVNVVLNFFMIRAPDGTRAEGHDFFYVSHGANFVERRPTVGNVRNLDFDMTTRTGSRTRRP